MRRASNFRFPPKQKEVMQKAGRLEWITVVCLLSVITVMYLTMGNSQAMKAAWFEDLLSLVPPLAFLISNKFADRQANEDFPYGYHRAINVGLLIGSVAILVMGGYIIFDSIVSLANADHPTIGGRTVFGYHIWSGWLMIPALLWGIIPLIVLGRLKIPLASELHDKQLYVDAAMNKADWLTGVAAIIGVLGIGFGLWWLDSVAAIIIGIDVFYDGIKNTSGAFADMMDSTPSSPDRKSVDPIVREAQEYLRNLDWVVDAEVRMREEGHVFFGEGYIVPRDGMDVNKFAEAQKDVTSLSWKLHEFVIVPVLELPQHLRAADPPLPD